MENKLIWSSDGNIEELLSMSPEEKRNYILEIEGDSGMVNGLPDEKVDQYIENEAEYERHFAEEELEYNLLPMMAKQCRDGISIMCDARGGQAMDLGAGDLSFFGSDRVELHSDENNNLNIVVSDHDGSRQLNLFALPEDEDKLKNFIEVCMDDFVQDLMDFNELDREEAIDNIIYELDADVIDGYCDFSKVPEVCDRIHLDVNEDLTEEQEINEVRVDKKQAKGLKKELEEIKPLVDDYGLDYITSMQFTSYDNDPESVEYQYPEFFRICKAYFLKKGGMGLISPEDVQKEIRKAENRGIQLSEEEALNNLLDLHWDTDFFKDDYDAVIKTCDIIMKKPGKNKQFEKVYRSTDGGLDDDKILADREAQEDEFEEGFYRDGNELVDDNSNETVAEILDDGTIVGKEFSDEEKEEIKDVVPEADFIDKVKEDYDDDWPEDIFMKGGEIIDANTTNEISDEEMMARLLDLLGSEERVDKFLADYDDFLSDDEFFKDMMVEEKQDLGPLSDEEKNDKDFYPWG